MVRGSRSKGGFLIKRIIRALVTTVIGSSAVEERMISRGGFEVGNEIPEGSCLVVVSNIRHDDLVN